MWERVLVAVLNRFFTVGRVELTLANGNTHSFGDPTAPPFHVHFHDDALIREVIINADMAMGEGYMDARMTLQDDDLDAFMSLLVRNRDKAKGHFFMKLRKLRHILRQITLRNPIGRAQDNVAHHYDLQADLYALFLDADKQYSCAYFEYPGQSLEDAQAAKKHHIARKLRIKKGMRVLDIGCGWGGMALTLARDYGAQVTGVTLSREQHKIAVDRVAEARLQDKIDIRLQDYRHVSEQFDRVVSVGMFEHVGPAHYGEYFKTVDKLLKPDGVALIHMIGGSGPPQLTSTWITKYIFPGGHIPALSEIAPHVERTGLNLADLEILRLHYADTLRAWLDRFMANRDAAAALYDERFVRMWRYYLLASEMTFRHGDQVVFQLQLSKSNEIVPTTRGYLYEQPLIELT